MARENSTGRTSGPEEAFSDKECSRVRREPDPTRSGGSPFFLKKEKNVPLQAGVQCNLQRQK